MTKILITYFDAFEGVPINPSDMVAHETKAKLATSAPESEIVLEKLPVTFDETGEQLRQAIKTYQPDAVLCTGVAVGRDKVSYERVAINLDDARIKDNAGQQLQDRTIVDGAPSAYFSTLPTRAAFEKVIQNKLPVELSYTAGTYVCNHVFFHALHATENTGIKAGFVHIPAITEIPESYARPGHRDTGGVEKHAPHLPLEKVAQAVELMVLETLYEL